RESRGLRSSASTRRLRSRRGRRRLDGWGRSRWPGGLGDEADAPGLDAQGYDFALKLVARLLEGADACHITSPLLFEPATIAASMAILRPKAIDDAPVCGSEPSGGWRR